MRPREGALRHPRLPATAVLQKDHPDHHDADLVLKLYDLRREALMREARQRVLSGFFPTSLDDVLAVGKLDHPLNAAFRQVSTYWEMAYSMARHGIVHAEFMLESNTEGLLLYTRVEPWLEEYRARVNPLAFRNAEWMAKETGLGRAMAERYRERNKAMMAARAAGN